MSKKFKIGDVVQLLSGGPKMTVQSESNEDSGVIWCKWFSGTKLQQGNFKIDSLIKIDEPEIS